MGGSAVRTFGQARKGERGRDGPPDTLGCARIVLVVLTLAGALDAFPLVLLTAVAAVVGDVRVGQLGLYGQR